MTTKRQCSEMILTDSVWNPSRPCHKPATVERDRVWYCKTHDPEYIKEKEAKQRDVWDKEFKLRRAEIKAGEQCLFINPDNPVAVAEAIGDMYEALKFVASEDKMTEKMRGIVLRTLNKVEEKNNV